jgi:transcriptional regulator with XRE-family HTH domain
MERNRKTEADVASLTGFSPMTIYRYLKGKRVNHSTQVALERLITQEVSAKPPVKQATG